jgi:hypothetical protein
VTPPPAPPPPPPASAQTARAKKAAAARRKAKAAAARREAARAEKRRQERAAARAAKRKAEAAAAAAAARGARDLPAVGQAADRGAGRTVVVTEPPAISPAAQRIFLVFAAIALACLAAAAAPVRVLRTVSGGLVWRRADLAFAALVLLSVGLLAVLAGAM